MVGASVFAFRERGLRADVCRSAEPPWLVIKHELERKADTMKITLQTWPAVEGQGRPGAQLTLHIGLDVHNDPIAVSVAPSDSTEVRRLGILGGTHEHVLRFLQKLHAAQ